MASFAAQTVVVFFLWECVPATAEGNKKGMGGKEERKANIFNYGMESNTAAQSLIFCETVKKINKQNTVFQPQVFLLQAQSFVFVL